MKTYKELVEACWKNYKQIGMKTKGKKLVPNCVPVDESLIIQDSFVTETNIDNSDVNN